MQTNTYETNPVGCLQERLQKKGRPTPTYALLQTGAPPGLINGFIMTVTLWDGAQCRGEGSNKKVAKRNAAKLMLDVLDGRAKIVSDEVSQAIDQGLKQLREVHCLHQGDLAPVENRGRNDDEDLDDMEKDEGGGHLRLPAESQDLDKWLADLLVDMAWGQLNREARAEETCKLCNLVFISEEVCDQHKSSSSHHRSVVQGIYPAESGCHCLLCWTSFAQLESLLNHIARPNHQRRAREAGVRKIWMEPMPLVPTWDTLKAYRHLRQLAEEEEERRNRRRSRSRSLKKSPSRSQSERSRSPEPWSADQLDWKAAQMRHWRAELGRGTREPRGEEEANQRKRRRRRGSWEQELEEARDRHKRHRSDGSSVAPGRTSDEDGDGRCQDPQQRAGGAENFQMSEEAVAQRLGRPLDCWSERRRRDGRDSDDPCYGFRRDAELAEGRLGKEGGGDGSQNAGGGGRRGGYQHNWDSRSRELDVPLMDLDLRNRLNRGRSRNSSGAAASSYLSRSPGSSRSEHSLPRTNTRSRSRSRSSKLTKRRKKHKSKKKKSRQRSLASEERSSEQDLEEEEQEIEEGELVKTKRVKRADSEEEQQQAVQKMKAAVLGILDEEIFSIQAGKRNADAGSLSSVKA